MDIIKRIQNTEKGKKLFINAILMTSEQVSLLRSLIRKGVLIPDTENYAIPTQVKTGEVILPQNFYKVSR